MPSSPPTPPASGLAGTVSDADGQAVAGAFVTARDEATGRAVSVRTDAQGAYRLPLTESGWTVEAHGIGVETTEAMPVPTLPARLDLRVSRAADLFGQLPASSYLGALPDGETKRAFILDCGGCHQFNRVRPEAGTLQRSREDWYAQTNRMLGFAGAGSPFPVISAARDPDATADWLVTALGEPGDPMPEVNAPAYALGREHAVITEYDVPASRDLPHDLMPDAEGRIVVTGMMTGQMYRLDPATGVWESFREGGFPGARALAIDGTGVWWVLLGTPRQVARFDPATSERASFGIGVYPHSIVLDRAGRVWYNAHFSREPETIGVVDPATGETRTYEVPTPPRADGGTSIPYGLRLGPDGTIWGTQLLGNRLLRFDPETETFRLYDLPTPVSGPRRPDIAPDGTVWIPLFSAGALARFDPQTETFREIPLPLKDALPYIVRVDPTSGVIWVATGAADAVLRYLPDEDQWSVHPLPTRGALVRHMELEPSGAAWVAYGNSPAIAPKVARIEIVE